MMHLMQFFLNMHGVGEAPPASDGCANHVQCGGNIFNNPIACITYVNSFFWITDSGASKYISSHPNTKLILLRLNYSTNCLIQLGKRSHKYEL